MPVQDGSDFEPSWPYRYGHYNTLVPYLFASTDSVSYNRLRYELPDGDFLDIDQSKIGSSTLAILCHGLEGNSDSKYIMQFARLLNEKNLDVVALNYRGCSGEMNRLLTMYNSGTTGDLDFVVSQQIHQYDQVILIGFSLGGNLILKYLGEEKYRISSKIRAGIAISTPVHLSDASRQLIKAQNALYQIKFLNSLVRKIRAKKKQFPDDINLRHLWKVRNLFDFDNYYTAPLFGYADAEEYYAQNQAIQFLEKIQVPSLIVNSLDDPFLGDLCYPYDVARRSEIVSLCAPRFGGHVGFASNRNDRSWIEEKVWIFIRQNLV